MKRFLLFLLLLAGAAHASDSTRLVPRPVFGKEAKLITDFLEGSHYRKIRFTDSLSSVIFNRYFEDLDNSKLYFLASDLKDFEHYRNRLDDLSRVENVTPAFEIFARFQDRYRARLRNVIDHVVNQPFDYSSDEYYETDRDHLPWAQSQKELDDLWRKVVKSQALSLKLTGKKQEEIADVLKKRYERLLKSYNQLNAEDVFSYYMNCITEAYDPHTNYLSPKATDLFKQSMTLSLEGIGARLQTENDYTKVAEILPGGPAEKSNLLHPNDLITAVGQGTEGEMVDVVGWRIDEVVKLIKGPKGTLVRLQVLPAATGVNGPPVLLSFVREKVKLEDQAAKKKIVSYRSNNRNYKLGVISLPSFYMDFDAYQRGDQNYRSTSRDVLKLVRELQKDSVDGIVMDLRNNGGGSLMEAIELTGLFIKQGPVVQVKESRGRVQVGADDDPSVAYAGPLVVLTNRFSASASEIFAGAIQDYRRGLVVGESTYGKGTVQSVVDLARYIRDKDQVGELKITFQKFYRVTGSSTQHKGVTPDILLPTALDPEQFGESASPSALPWDVIPKADFQKSGNINDKLIASLNKSYQDRLKSDPALKKYVSETEEVRKNLKETRISLNESRRRKEMEDAEKRKAANNLLDTKLGSKEGIPTDDMTNLKDEVLREGLLILADLALSRVG